MNTELSPSSANFGAYIGDKIVGFLAVINFPSKRPIKKVHRLVVLPDYQGIGIGVRLNDFVAEHYKKNGKTYCITTSTPALVHSFARNKRWKCYFKGKGGKHTGYSSLGAKSVKNLNNHCSINRITTSWKYIGDGVNNAVS